MNIPLTRRQSRAVDRIAIDKYGYSGLVLMENAGRGVVDVLLSVDPTLLDSSAEPVAILCGKGNNAGDGFVIARHLMIQGVPTKVVLLSPPMELRGDALVNYRLLGHSGIAIADLSSVDDLQAALSSEAASPSWIVDAMLGTGATGAPREPISTAIAWANAQAARRIAVDVPSGLDCDTGQASDTTVRADHTCTFVAAKTGFLSAGAREFLGTLHIVSIGVPPSLINEVASVSE